MKTISKVLIVIAVLFLIIPYALTELFAAGFISVDHQNDLLSLQLRGLSYSGVANISIPLIAIALITEIFFNQFSNTPFNKKDFRVNILLGLALIVSAFIVKGVELLIFFQAWSYSLFDIPVNILSWLTCWLAYDFLFYWFHRLGHEINFLWASHNTHHSSIEFNLTVGARNNILHVFYRFLFWMPLCFLGFHPIMVMTIDSLCTTQQFFLHTQKIRKLWLLDYVIGTPSNHRVHHGSNEQYIDKNYGAFLMIWDHLFGTFSSESEPVKYGLTTGAVSYSFFNLVFGYWIQMFHRFRGGESFIKIFFGRPSK